MNIYAKLVKILEACKLFYTLSGIKMCIYCLKRVQPVCCRFQISLFFDYTLHTKGESVKSLRNIPKTLDNRFSG